MVNTAVSYFGVERCLKTHAHIKMVNTAVERVMDGCL